MDRRSILLAVLGSAEGQAFSPVQLQKALFLLSRNDPGIFDANSKFDFVPYDYGPFDSAVYSEANALQLAGLVQVDQTSARYKRYSASPEGVIRAREILSSLPDHSRDYLRRVSEWVRALSFAALVKSIYEAYPEMKQNSIFAG